MRDRGVFATGIDIRRSRPVILKEILRYLSMT